MYRISFDLIEGKYNCNYQWEKMKFLRVNKNENYIIY